MQPQRAVEGVSEANQGVGVIFIFTMEREVGGVCVCVSVLNVCSLCCHSKDLPEMTPGPRWSLCQSLKAEQETSKIVSFV